jgi:hypothetical protein
MLKLNYADFELKIERAGDRYSANVLRSPAGEASHSFDLPFTEVELENLILRMSRLHRVSRRINSPEIEAAREVGTKLFQTVFTGEVLACLRASQEEASSKKQTGLRIKLRLQDVPELADMPWEFLLDPGFNRFLIQSTYTPIVRYIQLPQRIPSLQVTLPLRILGMISSPSDYELLDVQKEKLLLQEALEPLITAGAAHLEWIDQASLSTLLHRSRRDAYHVFHFIGHGGFDRRTDQGVLVFQDEQGHGQFVDARQLSTLLHDHPSLRLVVLNSCEGARNSRTDPFAGVAASLIQQGIPAVIAMQFEISDKAAITFASEFYVALASGLPVDTAVADARKAIYISHNGIEWGTPVLYMRSVDGVLFELIQTATTKTSHAEALPSTGTQAPLIDVVSSSPATMAPIDSEVSPRTLHALNLFTGSFVGFFVGAIYGLVALGIFSPTGLFESWGSHFFEARSMLFGLVGGGLGAVNGALLLLSQIRSKFFRQLTFLSTVVIALIVVSLGAVEGEGIFALIIIIPLSFPVGMLITSIIIGIRNWISSGNII